MVARWAVAGGRGQSGWRAAAVQDPGRRRDAGSAREGVLDRSDLVSERTVSRLFGRGCGHDLFREGGERGRRAPRPLPNLILTRGARRLAFLGGDDALVIMKGDISHKEFWLVDLKTGRERQLTNLGREFAIGDFDVSADGREIIFDRAREESDIVLFELPDR